MSIPGPGGGSATDTFAPPPGYEYRCEHGLPERDGDDESYLVRVRQMIDEGADCYEVVVKGGECCECGQPKVMPPPPPLPQAAIDSCCGPDPADFCCDCMGCCRDSACTVCSDLELTKSRGVDPDFYTAKGEDWYSLGDEVKRQQWPDAWCLALTRRDLLRMYTNMYGDDALGVLPVPSLRRADGLVRTLIRHTRGLGMHDASRLGPIVDEVSFF